MDVSPTEMKKKHLLWATCRRCRFPSQTGFWYTNAVSGRKRNM